MMYFINHVQTYSNVNRKGREMCEFIECLNALLVNDELSLDALKCEIQQKVEELNKKYPNSKKITFSSHADVGGRDGGFYIGVENEVDKYVCFLHYMGVRGTYVFSEKMTIGKGGGL